VGEDKTKTKSYDYRTEFTEEELGTLGKMVSMARKEVEPVDGTDWYANNGKPKILMVLGDYAGCYYYRILVPSISMAKITQNFDVKLVDHINQTDLEVADIVHFHRNWQPFCWEAVKFLKSMGKKVVYDIDDDFNSIPDWIPFKVNYNDWLVGATHNMMKAADVVTTSTQVLKDRFELLGHDNVVVCPNNILPEHYVYHDYIKEWAIEIEGMPTEGTFIGWAGSITHDDDLKLVMESIDAILTRRKDTYFIVMMTTEVEELPDFLKQHPTGRIFHIPSVNVERYPIVLSSLNLDIAVAPLVDHEFNHAKSNIKVLEYGMVKAAVVASDVTPYSNTIEHQKDGLVVPNTFRGWRKALFKLVDNPELVKEYSTNLQQKVIDDYNIHTAGVAWENVYNKLLT